MTTEPPPLAGTLLIDKPEGPTSMTACRRVRRALVAAGAPKRVKVGHGGTLDPLATGLLVILVGKATPLCNTIMEGDKDYTAVVDLSAFTTTDDREGERTEIDAPPPALDDINAALPRFTGTIMQAPPAHSAMKVGGQRAYKLAREGKPPKLEPRPVTIHTLAVTAYQWPHLTLEITCGKGTYIRSLARDLGASLGTGGSLNALRRTRIGEHHVNDAITLDELPESLTQADLTPVDLRR